MPRGRRVARCVGDYIKLGGIVFYRDPANGYSSPEVNACFREMKPEEVRMLKSGDIVWHDTHHAGGRCGFGSAQLEVAEFGTNGHPWRFRFRGQTAETVTAHGSVRWFKLTNEQGLIKLIRADSAL